MTPGPSGVPPLPRRPDAGPPLLPARMNDICRRGHHGTAGGGGRGDGRVRHPRLRPLEDLLLKDVRHYETTDAARPAMEVHRMALGLNALKWFFRRHGIVSLWGRGARMRLFSGPQSRAGRTHAQPIDRTGEVVRFRPDGFNLKDWRVQTLGMEIQSAGAVHRRRVTTRSRPRHATTAARSAVVDSGHRTDSGSSLSTPAPGSVGLFTVADRG